MAQVTLDRLRRFGITPDTNLGQHFLVDDNILLVIERLAELGEADVVYEPGPGVGVLTGFLAERVRHVHAVEIDRRLAPALDALVADHPNIGLAWGDATDVDPAVLDPVPTKLVSNLPYHVSGPIIAETLRGAPTVELLCVMVQVEVADRLFAGVGSRSYGALSVLVQATCTRTGLHRVSRAVFLPRPNVDSTLVAFRRDRGLLTPQEVPVFAGFTRTAFAHRRKTLVNNLTAAGHGREAVQRALAAGGLGPSARPQELAPPAMVELWRALLDGSHA